MSDDRLSSELQFICPHTSRLVPTGIITPPRTLDNVKDSPVYAWCPHCNREHEVKVRDTFTSSGGSAAVA